MEITIDISGTLQSTIIAVVIIFCASGAFLNKD